MTTPPTSSSSAPHTSVMVDEVLDYLNVQSGGRYIDCTVGAGGHSAAILDASGPDGRLLGVDADPQALEIAEQRLAAYPGRFVLRQSYFDHLAEVAEETTEMVPANGVLCDLGISSIQLDRPERGFSFQREGPLDMRFGPDAELTAADIVNEYSQEELARVLYEYGDEWRSRRIARAIVERRPLTSTHDLAKAVEQAVGKSRSIPISRVHPATKTFLALRLAVNQELRRLSDFLALAHGLLGFGSRIVILSFHSNEDRIVKNFFRDHSRGEDATYRTLTKKVIRPTPDEVQRNPRSRSARLRAAEVL
jgi:16S rRNA (cytosine1402-N4)-methyltransferase